MTDRGAIAVAGATGRQGGAVARRLLADGWHVRALTRRPDGVPARRLAELGAEVVQVDMMDRAQLDRAFQGVYGVYSVQNPMPDGMDAEIRQGTNVGDAAAAAGVRHVVYGSAGTGEPGTGIAAWESKVAIAAHLRRLGLPLTVLRPTAFMELMTDKAFYPPVSVWSLMPKMIGPDRRLPWICVDDLGAVAARAFAEPDRFIGADLGLAADLRSIAECRAIWRAVTGKAPRGFPMPVRLFERFTGPDLTRMWRWLRAGDPKADVSGTRAILPDAATVRECSCGGRSSRPDRPALVISRRIRTSA